MLTFDKKVYYTQAIDAGLWKRSKSLLETYRVDDKYINTVISIRIRQKSIQRKENNLKAGLTVNAFHIHLNLLLSRPAAQFFDAVDLGFDELD
jgi:hypothetical protein